MPRSAYETAAQLAIEQGVPIVTLSVPDDLAPPFITVLTNEATFNAIGKLLGAWVAADGGEDSHAAIFILAPFDVHVALGEGIKSELERLCSTCSGEIINTQVTDIGTEIPGLSVSLIERSSEINYLLYADGSMAGGVVAALRDANLADSVRIGGMNPGPAELQAIIDGEQHVYLNLPEQWIAWSAVDALVRNSVGDDPAVGMTSVMPTQLMVADNTTSTQPPLGAVNQEALFEALWLGGGASVPAGLAEARVLADAATAVPTSIGHNVALSATPPRGQRIAVVICDLPPCTRVADHVKDAGAILGWEVETIQFDGSPEDILEKFEFALEQNPDGIITSGVPRSAYETAAQLAIEQGVPIVTLSVPDDLAPPFITVLTNEATFNAIGKLLGAWVAADGGEDSHAAIFILAPFDVHVALGEGIKSELERLCSTCSGEIINTQVTDIGTEIPGLSVSLIERSSEINYLLYADGSMAGGVVAALRDANLADSVRIGGMNPGPAELQAIIDGEQHVYLNLPEQWIAWSAVDALVRNSVGDDPAVGMTSVMPTQLMVADNTTSTQPPLGAVNQEALFEALWLGG